MMDVGDMTGMLNSVMDQAKTISSEKKISWKVKEFSSIDEISGFLNDGKNIRQLNSFPFRDKIVIMYAIGG